SPPDARLPRTEPEGDPRDATRRSGRVRTAAGQLVHGIAVLQRLPSAPLPGLAGGAGPRSCLHVPPPSAAPAPGAAPGTALVAQGAGPPLVPRQSPRGLSRRADRATASGSVEGHPVGVQPQRNRPESRRKERRSEATGSALGCDLGERARS